MSFNLKKLVLVVDVLFKKIKNNKHSVIDLIKLEEGLMKVINNNSTSLMILFGYIFDFKKRLCTPLVQVAFLLHLISLC